MRLVLVAFAVLASTLAAGCPLRTVCKRGYTTSHDDAGALVCTADAGPRD